VVLALLCGGSAAVGVNSYMKTGGPKAAAADMTQVVVAAVDLPRGTTVTKEHVKVLDVPRGQAHARAITKVDDALTRAVMTPLIKDEALLEDKLAPKGSRGSMAWVTKPGMRAFTIHTPSLASGVAGFVMPGDRVDVLLTLNGEGNDGTGGGSTSTLLQNLEVMAVDQTIEAPSENKLDINHIRSVTLQVTPDQSLKLELGQNRGTLHLSLRNPEDSDDAQTKTATLTELRMFRPEPPPAAAEPVEPEVPVVEEVKGPPPPKPIYVYHAASSMLTEHRNDGTSARRILTQGSAQMAIPTQVQELRSQDFGSPPVQVR
jgi:pilus assembly protein CpaB